MWGENYMESPKDPIKNLEWCKTYKFKSRKILFNLPLPKVTDFLSTDYLDK